MLCVGSKIIVSIFERAIQIIIFIFADVCPTLTAFQCAADELVVVLMLLLNSARFVVVDDATAVSTGNARSACALI